MNVELNYSAADITFDVNEMTITINHADSSGVSGSLSLYLDQEDLSNLAVFFLDALAVADMVEKGEEDEEDSDGQEL